MARGNFWEMTYDPDWDGPDREHFLDDLQGSTGLHRCKVTSPEAERVELHWTVSRAPHRTFLECDFEAVVGGLVSNCTFERCRFRNSIWQEVKFSNCRFVKCDFSRAYFKACVFVNSCTFQDNSTSGELFRIEETALSAGSFIRSLKTNLRYLPVGETELYQRYRFVGTKQKIAKAVYSATKAESDLDYYFEAYEELVRSTLEHKVREPQFIPGTKKPRRKLPYLVKSLPARLERHLTLASGWLTAWGRSLLRPTLFFLAVVMLFTVIYYAWNDVPDVAPLRRWATAAMQAWDITLVAGYTAHSDPTEGLGHHLIRLCNVVLGLYWYSLVIPVLSRRILR